MEAKLTFDPVNRVLRDIRGSLRKHVSCPKQQKWSDLSIAEREGRTENPFCGLCDRSVLNTKNMTPGEIVNTLNEDPTSCVAITLGQDNIHIKVQND